MQEPSIVHNTFVLEYSYPKPPATVFGAFAEAAKKRSWFAEGQGHDLQHYELDFRVGGAERLIYKLKAGTPVSGMVIVNEGRYQEIVPGRRIVTSTTMDLADNRILIALVTFEFQETDSGTDLILTEQGAYLDGVRGLTPQMLEAGWRKLLEQLGTELTR